MNGKINPEVTDCIRIASGYARESLSGAIEPAHLFKALLHKDVGLIRMIERELRKDYYYLLDWADTRISMLPKGSRPVSDIELSLMAEEVIAEAEEICKHLGEEEVTPRMILASIVTPGVGFSFDQLKSMPLTKDEILGRNVSAGKMSVQQGGSTTDNKKLLHGSASSASRIVDKYCISLNAQVEEGDTDPVVGFEKELSEIYDILGRRTKSNILITGESGVGKSSLIKAFVQAIVKGETPGYLSGAQVYELDQTALAMEVSYRSEVEGRLKKLLDELATQGNVILVIEGLDRFMDKQSMTVGCAGVFKNKLNQGLLTICTSSVEGYTKNIETDKELDGKFERINLDEPTTERVKYILDRTMGKYGSFHGLDVDPEVSETAIRLAKRYFSEKRLPESAIDMIDRTMALIKSTNDIALRDLERLQQKFETLKESDLTEEAKAEELKWLYYEIADRISPLLTSEVEMKDSATLGSFKDGSEYVGKLLAELITAAANKINSVKPSHLHAVVARKTGIPMGNIQSKERDRLTNAEEIMKQRVVGQDHAIKIVLDSIYESRSGLNKKGQPMGSFFFLGPTGTGKTELAKSLADFLFQDETAILRFDMSEYKEEHSVALLYGAPPGYVGYEEGGLLVNQIRRKPYSVVLFDEIEKAHRSVFDLFLQILDEGKLHDRLGRVGDFSNSLILFTSNIGSQYIFDSFAQGRIPTHNDMLEVMQGNFRPEFLARLTEIVPFSPINEKIVLMIFNIHLKGLYRSLAEQNITLEISDEAKRQIAMRGFNAQYGARPILGIIRKEIRRPLSKMIISGELKSGDTVALSLDNEGALKWEIR